MSVQLLSESVAELEAHGEIRPEKRMQVCAKQLAIASNALLNAATNASRVPYDMREDLPARIRKLLDGMEGIRLDGCRALYEEADELAEAAQREARRRLKAIQ